LEGSNVTSDRFWIRLGSRPKIFQITTGNPPVSALIILAKIDLQLTITSKLSLNNAVSANAEIAF
jgi:predicted nuclease of predicted toxin-antitoxin system